MDATRLGITFQEAQAVLRNIRKRHSGTCDPRLSREYEHDIKRGDASTCSSTLDRESPYFKSISKALPTPIHTPSPVVSSETQAINPQTLSKPSSIGKRLEEFKQCRVQEQQDRLKTPSQARKATNPGKLSVSQQLKMVKKPVLKNSFKKNDLGSDAKLQQKVPNAGGQMNITSYLPKVKHLKKNAKAEEQMHTVKDICLAKLERVAEENVESMNLEERELVKKKILAASNISCTLVYVDGSTLLRPGTTKTPVKAIYLSLSTNVACSSKDYCHIVFPLTSVKENNFEYYQWLREFFSIFMSNENSNKVVYDAQTFIKTLISVLNIDPHTVCLHRRCFDPKIASWLLDPDHPPENFDALLRDGFGKGKRPSKEQESDDIGVNDHVGEDMFSLLSLMPNMFLTLQEKNLWDLFCEVEMKVCPILAAMEFVGVEVDTKLFLDYGNILERKIKKLEEEGYKSVGHSFQMSSTQQLRNVLFTELQLDKKVQKRLQRTQIKNYKSTSENVLRHLQDFHPLPNIILEYRSVTKMKSAYVDGILNYVKKDILLTNWNQTCTATGRLTSTNPNIQAIPKNQLNITGVSKEFIIGKEMKPTSIIPRKAFKSRTGWSLLSSDFQSIELRLLAHFSDDPLLLRIFNESEQDIFVQLASIWLSVDPESLQDEDRERAKRVVYSVVYGVGKERLADTLNVSADQAKSFTTSFLSTFTGLKHFIQSCINECRNQGYVTTIFGRRRLLPGINSNDPSLRSQSERQAVNFVIQGSAADICKMGMIMVVQSLEKKDLNLKARLLIQIHDELVLEVQDNYIEKVKELVKACLEDTDALCGGHVKLKVNMKVSVSCGKTWAEMQSVC